MEDPEYEALGDVIVGPRDPVQSIHSYWKAAAQYGLADLFLDGGDDSAPGMPEAIDWLTLSAAQGNAAAIERLATLRKQRSSSAL